MAQTATTGGHWITVVSPITGEPTQIWTTDNYFPQTGLSSPDNGDNEPNMGGGLPTQRPGITFNSPDVGPMPTDITPPNPSFDSAGNFTGPSYGPTGDAASAAAPTAAPPNLWHTAANYAKQAIPAVIGGAFTYAAGKQQANASKEAAQIQAAEYDKALALQKQMFDQRIANLAPYRQIGVSALASLAKFMGYPAQPAAANPSAPGFSGQVTTPAGQAIPLSSSPSGVLNQWGQGKSGIAGIAARQAAPDPTFTSTTDLKNASPPRGYATVQAPNGSRYYIPPDRVQEVVAQGGKVLSGGPV